MALLPLTGAQGAAGVEGNSDSTTSCSSLSVGSCTRRAISSDGSRVVFTSKATNLVDGDANDQADIFLATVAADGSHSLERISVPDPASGGTGAEADDDSATAAVSLNGQWVAFESDASNLVGGDTNNVTDIFLYHVATKRLSRISVPDEATALTEANLRSFGPSVADDGSVAFTSFATNLVTSGVPQFQAVYVRRLTPAGTFLAAPSADGPSRHASISADGTKVAFISAGSNLDAFEVPDHEDDVFVYTVGAGLARVTADAGAEEPSLRPDGASVAFVSDSSQFDADGLGDVVVMAVGGGDIKVLGDCACDPSMDRSAHAPFLAAGDVVAFQSPAPLGPAVTNDQVWVRDAAATLALVSQAPGGPVPNGSSRYVSLSGDGSRAVFTSSASNLVTGDSNGRTDVFLRQLPGGSLVRLSERPAATPPPTTPATTPAPPTTDPGNVTPLEAPPVPVPTTEPPYLGVNRTGYWMLDGDGNVYGFGSARVLGSPVKELGNTHASDIEPTPSGNGYWVVDRRGRVYSYGDAAHYGNADRVNFTKDEKVTSLSATSTGRGYWIFTTSGRVLAHGDAAHHGDLAAVKLNGPVLDSIPTASGRGYYMVASDGGIFTFGDAKFYGSLGNIRLNAPVQSLVPDGDGKGYWLVASDGGAFTFETPFRGSMGGRPLNKPMTGMIPFGNGYLMVAEDGGIFNFSNLPFFGSLGDRPPVEPVVAVAAR